MPNYWYRKEFRSQRTDAIARHHNLMILATKRKDELDKVQSARLVAHQTASPERLIESQLFRRKQLSRVLLAIKLRLTFEAKKIVWSIPSMFVYEDGSVSVCIPPSPVEKNGTVRQSSSRRSALDSSKSSALPPSSSGLIFAPAESSATSLAKSSFTTSLTPTTSPQRNSDHLKNTVSSKALVAPPDNAAKKYEELGKKLSARRSGFKETYLQKPIRSPPTHIQDRLIAINNINVTPIVENSDCVQRPLLPAASPENKPRSMFSAQGLQLPLNVSPVVQNTPHSVFYTQYQHVRLAQNKPHSTFPLVAIAKQPQMVASMQQLDAHCMFLRKQQQALELMCFTPGEHGLRLSYPKDEIDVLASLMSQYPACFVSGGIHACRNCDCPSSLHVRHLELHFGFVVAQLGLPIYHYTDSDESTRCNSSFNGRRYHAPFRTLAPFLGQPNGQGTETGASSRA
jgi:hypothetical protein